MTAEGAAQPGRGERLYALSYLGAQLGFMPLFMLLLPRRVLAIDPGHALATLSWLLVLGGVVASGAHIAAGAIGDFWMARHGSRRAVIAAGLVGLVGAYGLLSRAGSIVDLAVGVGSFQLALNLMFAPLGALMTDYVANDRKGRVAGLLNAGLPLSALIVTGLARYFPIDDGGAFIAIAALVTCMVGPLLIIWPFPRNIASPPPRVQGARPAASPRLDRHDLSYAWAGRLLMQLGAALLINYIFLYVAGLRETSRLAGMPEATWAVGLLSLVAGAVAVISAVLAGFGSDAQRRRRLPMVLAALTATAALALLAQPASWVVMLMAYGLFQAALTAYLAIDSAMVAQLVGGHPRRGAWLGLMNLTNTLPGVIAAIIALLNVARAPDAVALSHLVLACAAASLTSAVLVSRIRTLR